MKKQLQAAFKLKDWGELRYFLGYEIARSSTGIVMSQRQYALDLLESAGLLASKPSNVPLQPNQIDAD